MHRNPTGLLILAAFLAVGVAVLLGCQAQGPCPDPWPHPAGGTTNLDSLTLGEDLDVTGTSELDGGFTVDDTAFIVADTSGNMTTAGTATFTGAMSGPAIGTENLRLPTIESSTVITSSDGAMWTVGASEVWWIDRVFCNVTTNFDCTGDDCTIEIGLTGGDIDGFLDLDDGELQTTDAEIAGLTAGWQGFGSTDTRGAFFAAGGGVILANDTIDIKIEDNSDQSNPTAGAATCYSFYTRLQ
jgi:hypothetical protein